VNPPRNRKGGSGNPPSKGRRTSALSRPRLPRAGSRLDETEKEQFACGGEIEYFVVILEARKKIMFSVMQKKPEN